jgi:hypothetical protein
LRDDVSKRDGQQQIWELSKSLELEKAQHEGRNSEKAIYSDFTTQMY